MKTRTRLDDFNIGDLCQNGLKTKPLHGIVVGLEKLNNPENGDSRNKSVKIKWIKHTGETRETWYSHGQNFWWLHKIKILAKARLDS